MKTTKPLRRESLFRSEATKQSDGTWSGRVILMRPISFILYVVSSLAILFMIVCFLFLGKYTRQEQAIGFIRPSLGVSSIVTFKSGIVEEIHIKEGEIVSRGDALVTIKTVVENRYGTLSSQQQLELDDQVVLEETSLIYRLKNIKSEHRRLKSNVKNLNGRLVNLNERLKIQKNRMRIVTNEYLNLKKVHETGGISISILNAKEKEFSEMKIVIVDIKQNILTIQHEIELTNIAIEKLKYQKVRTEINSQLAQSNINLSSLNTSGQDNYVVRSPIDGVVGVVYETENNSIMAGSDLMSIVPSGNTWIAEMYLPTEAIGNITVDSSVYMKYVAFPYQKYGMYEGTIRFISKTIVAPRNIPAELGVIMPMYKIMVELKDQHVAYGGKILSLQSGMSLSASITGETRTIMGWMLGPLMDIKRSFGEK